MYEILDPEKSYKLPDGTEVTGQYFVDSDQYDTTDLADTVVNSVNSYVNSFDRLSMLKDSYAVTTEDPTSAIEEINNIVLMNKRLDSMEKSHYKSMFSAVQMVALSLTDEQAIEVADLYPEYEIGHEYKQNDRFQYGNSLYKVNQAHTSQAQWVPGEVGTESLYTNLMLNDAGYQIWKQPTGAHDAYNTGDVVEYNGTLYKSLIDGNAWAPDVYPAGWQEYDESTSTEPGTPEPSTPDPGTETYPDFVQPTGAHDAYKKGDIVRYNGKLYQSLIDANAYSPDAYPQGWQEYSEE